MLILWDGYYYSFWAVSGFIRMHITELKWDGVDCVPIPPFLSLFPFVVKMVHRSFSPIKMAYDIGWSVFDPCRPTVRNKQNPEVHNDKQ